VLDFRSINSAIRSTVGRLPHHQSLPYHRPGRTNWQTSMDHFEAPFQLLTLDSLIEDIRFAETNQTFFDFFLHP